MKVTVRDVTRPDDGIYDWPHMPHLGLPYPGDEVILPRGSWQPRETRAHVARYRWDLERGELHMLVTVGK